MSPAAAAAPAAVDARLNASANRNPHANPRLEAPEAEIAVLGGMLIDGDAARLGARLLAADDFADGLNRLVFGAMRAILERGGAVDPVTVGEYLRERGRLEDTGGMAYLAELLDAVPTAANLEYHARIVSERALRRRVADVARTIQSDAVGSDVSVEELAAQIRRVVAEFEERVDARGASVVLNLPTLADLLTDPDLVRPPQPIIPRLAWPGRIVLLHAPEKAGKTTYGAAALAVLSAGEWWLNEPLEPSPVLYALLPGEAPPGDVVRALRDFGADPNRTFVLSEWPAGDPVGTLRAAIETSGARAVVVDSLAALAEAAGTRPDSGDGAAWLHLLRPLVEATRATGAAVVLLHHSRRSDGQYRDSSAIGAAVDAILAMSEVDGDPTLRRIKARGRWSIEDHAVRLVGNRYELAVGEVTFEARILAFLGVKPGASTSAVRAAVGGKAMEVDAALERLKDAGSVEDRGDNSHHKWHRRARPEVRPGDSDDTRPGVSPGSVPQQLTADRLEPVPENTPGVESGTASIPAELFAGGGGGAGDVT